MTLPPPHEAAGGRARTASAPLGLRDPAVRGVVGLYGLTPEWDDTARLLDAIAQAVRGGMQALQFRRKHLDDAARLAQGRSLRAACRQHGIAFIVNDDWRLALELEADGVHLGRDDAEQATVRRLADEGMVVGVSCYNELDRVRAAIDAGAASVGMGAVYPSSTKPGAVRVSLETLRAARRLCEDAARAAGQPRRVGVIAIGGITPGNAAPVAAAGADALALITGLFEAADVEAAARATMAAMAPR
ncbi:thiamine phosphate synthase [Verticiella sediminum]|uniref:Thiamine-phosphate synthase n=1 Tax=Verticiella sediminum TaxID=1247510 RepID=A0A556A7I6_9BURK|nr:thiamine phosphate synthase [Verticiella sediminum]TSH88855.1 thiamine phosphate synthase [Verticiella sediminum]